MTHFLYYIILVLFSSICVMESFENNRSSSSSTMSTSIFNKNSTLIEKSATPTTTSTTYYETANPNNILNPIISTSPKPNDNHSLSTSSSTMTTTIVQTKSTTQQDESMLTSWNSSTIIPTTITSTVVTTTTNVIPSIDSPTLQAQTSSILYPNKTSNNVNNNVSNSSSSVAPPPLVALYVRVHDDSSYAANLRHHHNVHAWGPHFEDTELININMTVTEGDNVTLDCRVGLLEDKLVSWVRRRKNDKLDLLTLGSTNHSSDTRIWSDFKYPNNWRLTIRNTSINDSGIYICQISTHPPKVFEIQLTVQAPRVAIINSRGERINEVHYMEGSTLQLICSVNNIMSKSLSWYHNKEYLNQDVSRGGVNIKSDLTSEEHGTSILRVSSVSRKDGGVYLCSTPPYNASVVVHILNGENPAELYRNPAAKTSSTIGLIITLSVLIVVSSHSHYYLYY